MADAQRQGEAPADAASVVRALPHTPWQTSAIQISQSTGTYVAEYGDPVRVMDCIICAQALLSLPFVLVTLISCEPCEHGAINHIPCVTVAIHSVHIMPPDQELVDIILKSTAPCFGRM